MVVKLTTMGTIRMNSRQGLGRVSSQRESNSQQRKNAYIIDKFILPLHKTETHIDVLIVLQLTPSTNGIPFPLLNFPHFRVCFFLMYAWVLDDKYNSKMNQRATHFNLGSTSGAYASTYSKEFNSKLPDPN